MKKTLIRFFTIWVIYVVLHYLYDFFPIFFISIFSGTHEAILQHIKISFFVYTFVTIVEYFCDRKNLNFYDFISKRMLLVFIFSWLSAITWMFVPALLGKVGTVLYDIIYANIALAIALYFTIEIEGLLDKVKLSKRHKIIMLIIFLVTGIEFVAYTYRVPYFPFF